MEMKLLNRNGQRCKDNKSKDNKLHGKDHNNNCLRI